MSNYEKVIAENENAVGFIVSFGYWNNYYVEVGNLLLGDSCVLFQSKYYERNQIWSVDKNFYWANFFRKAKVHKIEYSVDIKEVTEVPDWLEKTKEIAEKESEEYSVAKRKNTLIRRILRKIFIGS